MTPRNRTLRLFGIHIASILIADRKGWLRLFNKGIYWKDARKYDLVFSERYGRKRFIRIGNYLIGILP